MPPNPRNQRRRRPAARTSGARSSLAGSSGHRPASTPRPPASSPSREALRSGADPVTGPTSSFQALLGRSDHEGPQWRHRPSIRQALAAAYVSVVPLIAVVSPLIAGIEGTAGIVVKFAAAAATYWLSLQATELVYHRLLRR